MRERYSIMKHVYISLTLLILFALACSAGGSVVVTPTLPAPDGILPGVQSPCGDGVCDAAEQADPNLCPADCAGAEAEPPPTEAAESPTEALPADLTFIPDPGIRIEAATQPSPSIAEDGAICVFYTEANAERPRTLVAGSADGLVFSDGVDPNTVSALHPHANQLPDGTWRVFMFDSQTGALSSLSSPDGFYNNFTPDEGVRYAAPDGHLRIGVWDEYVNAVGEVILLYIGDMAGSDPHIRQAISTDGGWTFFFHEDNPLGDSGSGHGYSHVDPKFTPLPDGPTRLFTMVQGENSIPGKQACCTIYSFITEDGGYTYTQEPGARLSSDDFTEFSVWSLNDLWVIRLPDGRYRMYVAALIDGGRGDTFWGIVSATTPDAGSAAAPPPTDAARPVAAPTSSPVNDFALEQDFITFSINVQDFAYPEESTAILRKIVALHEEHGVPVDVFLTTTMADIFASQAPELLERLKSSPVVSVSYHVRPPKPYYTRYDWLGLGKMLFEQRYETIMSYETHRLDLVTGQPAADPGGYQRLAQQLGYSPPIVGVLEGGEIGAAARAVFGDLGASFAVVHGRTVSLGETRDGLYLKPEHYDVRLFQHVGQDASGIIEDALLQAHNAGGARPPYFVGIKMHGNDFFAERSAWLTVYIDGGRRPLWNPDLKSALLSAQEQEQMWALYESTVAYAASIRDRVALVNAPMILTLEQEAQSAVAATQPPGAETRLYISAAMHIENRRRTWPDPDALIAFLERATATGMRWSVGADIDWLQQEPCAGEIIRATEALGVQWDVHTHDPADRAAAASRITELGGHPTDVVSGLLVPEIDALSQPLTASDGYVWQAGVLWGISGLTGSAGHGPGNDDVSIGLWRPAGAADYTTHDPNGTLIAVGGGTRDNLADIEALAEAIATGGDYPPVLSISIMAQPATLKTPASDEGIEAIEAWAARLTPLPFVHWATIAETAAAWKAAGGLPSRMEVWP